MSGQEIVSILKGRMDWAETVSGKGCEGEVERRQREAKGI